MIAANNSILEARVTCPVNESCEALAEVQDRTNVQTFERFPGEIVERTRNCQGDPVNCLMAKYAIERLAQWERV